MDLARSQHANAGIGITGRNAQQCVLMVRLKIRYGDAPNSDVRMTPLWSANSKKTHRETLPS